MYKYFTILIMTLFVGHQSFSQSKATIKGTVKTSDGKPAELVTIGIIGSNKGAVVDNKGNYIIKNIDAGKYTVEARFVGLETKTQNVTIEDGQTITLNFILTESQEKLNEVVVQGNKLNKFNNKKSTYVARMPIENLENPQVYNVITKELLREQVVVNFDDALKNAPGVTKLWTSTGRSGDGAGYYTIRGFSVQPRLINGVAGSTNGSPDPANIESIETIKGPSGTLFGSSLVSFGGLINTVTKKPYNNFGGEASFTGGSFGLYRITADVNTPLDKEKNLLFRVNTAYHDERNFQDAGFKKSIFLAPSISYQVNERLSFLVNTEFFSSERTNPLMLFLNRTRELVKKSPDDFSNLYDRSFTSDDVTIKNPTANLYGQINYKISDSWTSQTNLSRSIQKSDGYYQYVMFILPGDSLLNRYVSNQKSTSISTDIQQNFIGDFAIGSIRNRLVVGFDVYNIKANNNNSAYILFDTLNINRADAKYTMLTRSALETKLAQNTNPTKTVTNTFTYSAYISDVINITDNLIAMLSLRADRFDYRGTYNLRTDATTGRYMQTAFSPKLGVVYQPIKDKVSVFANYMNGFQNVGPVTQPDGSVDVFKPQQANQFEGGVKSELLSGKLTGTISYYDIYVTNVTIPDVNRPGFNVQEGNISSKGFEFDLIANPIAGLNIVAGYGYNLSANEKTNDNIIGRRPVSSGPKHVANLWASYKIENGSLQGLGLGAGGNYFGENAITNSLATGAFIIPANTIVNASLFYDRPSYRFGLKVDNLSNKKYWSGWTTLEPQMPRRVLMSLALKF